MLSFVVSVAKQNQHAKCNCIVLQDTRYETFFSAEGDIKFYMIV